MPGTRRGIAAIGQLIETEPLGFATALVDASAGATVS